MEAGARQLFGSLQRFRRDVEEPRLVSGQRRDMGDAEPHRAGAEDGDLSNLWH